MLVINRHGKERREKAAIHPCDWLDLLYRHNTVSQLHSNQKRERVTLYIHTSNLISLNKISSVQLFSRVRLFETPWTAVRQASLSITNSQSLLQLMPIESVMPSNHVILCHPLFLPSVFLSIRVFSNESVLHIRWSKYWSFSFGISPSNEYSGLISFRMDCLDLLVVQGTLKSLLQHLSSKASILQFSAFFIWSNSHIHTWLLEKP